MRGHSTQGLATLAMGCRRYAAFVEKEIIQ